MKRKIGYLALIALVGTFVFNRTNLGSYLATAWANVRHTAKSQVPLEFEIDRIRHEIVHLDDDMRGQLAPIAEEMATVKTLRRKVDTTRASLKSEKISLLAMTRQLESGTKYVVTGDEEYSAEDVKAKLASDFASYQRCEAELKSQGQLLAAKEQSLKAVREQLASMKSLKRDLEVQVAQLEAELKTVRLAQTRDKYQLDDSRLSDIKASLTDIEHRLNVERAKTELNGQFAGPALRGHKKVRPTAELTTAVNKYFGANAPAATDKTASAK
jgi:septation ring formation regulator EzrA